MIIFIGYDDQFADLAILSFFLTADHLNGLSSCGGPLHHIPPPPPTVPTQLSASAYWAVLGYQQAPHDSLTGSSRAIGWDFTSAYALKDACVLAKSRQHVFVLHQLSDVPLARIKFVSEYIPSIHWTGRLKIAEYTLGIVMPYFCMFSLELSEVSIVAVFSHGISFEIRCLRKRMCEKHWNEFYLYGVLMMYICWRLEWGRTWWLWGFSE